MSAQGAREYLTTEEIREFWADTAHTVGRLYYGRVAHIYMDGNSVSLCGKSSRELTWSSMPAELAPFWKGDRTCQECIRRFRKRSNSNDGKEHDA